MFDGMRVLRICLLLNILVTLSSFSTLNSNDKVYICMKGDVFHSMRDCRGLRNVKSKVIAVTRSEAETKYKRRPCKICINK